MPLFSGFHVSNKKSAFIRILFSNTLMCYFSLAVFKTFSLFFVFRSLVMMCLGIYFFGFILFGVNQASLTCGFMSFTKFGGFSAIICLNTLLAPLSLLICDLSDRNVGSLVFVP